MKTFWLVMLVIQAIAAFAGVGAVGTCLYFGSKDPRGHRPYIKHVISEARLAVWAASMVVQSWGYWTAIP